MIFKALPRQPFKPETSKLQTLNTWQQYLFVIIIIISNMIISILNPDHRHLELTDDARRPLLAQLFLRARSESRRRQRGCRPNLLVSMFHYVLLVLSVHVFSLLRLGIIDMLRLLQVVRGERGGAEGGGGGHNNDDDDAATTARTAIMKMVVFIAWQELYQ